MSRSNLILLVVLAVLVGVWLLGRDWERGKTTEAAPRMFPEFNLEAADRIEIDGGWPGSKIVLTRLGSDWKVASAGGFPAKGEAADKFIKAVYNLRRENEVGSVDRTYKDTQTDDQLGRRVTVFQGDTQAATFTVGKNPQGSYQEIFIRNQGKVFRTRTVLPEDLEVEQPNIPGFPRMGPRGFDWHNHVNNLQGAWVETRIWDLSKLEESELWLTRDDGLDVKLVKLGDDKWEMTEAGKEKAPADADAATSLLGQIRYLYLNDVAGLYDDVAQEYGLDKPAISLVMTLKQKIEKEEEAKEEGAEEEEKEEPAEEWKTVKRTFEVGKKVERPNDYRDGEVKTEEYYAVKIGGIFDDPTEEEKSRYVYLVSDYRIAPLRKELDEFRQEEEKKDEEKEAGDEPGEDKPGGTEDAPKEDEPKGDEPKTDEPKGDEPKTDEPKADEPKKDDPPKTDEPKKEDPPKGDG